MRITREIGIDMGHRVHAHQGKCKSLHGHRYRIEVTLQQPEVTEGGSEDGMIMDFGFIKDVMMAYIDAPCDHGTCLSILDPEAGHALGQEYNYVAQVVKNVGHYATSWRWGKLYMIKDTPTAENLAFHWYQRLLEPILDHIGERGGMLYSVRVWETPNCNAVYKATRTDLHKAAVYKLKDPIVSAQPGPNFGVDPLPDGDW